MIIADHFTGIAFFKGNHFVTCPMISFFPIKAIKSVFAVDEDELGRYWFGTNTGITVYILRLKLINRYNS